MTNTLWKYIPQRTKLTTAFMSMVFFHYRETNGIFWLFKATKHWIDEADAQPTMKCFSSQLVRKFLILSAAMMVLINLLCMWKVSDQIEKEKEKKLEAKLTIKLKKVNHSYLINLWHSKVATVSGQQFTSRGQLSTDRWKQEDKSPATPVYHTSFRENEISTDSYRIKQPKANSEWPTKQVRRLYLAPSSLWWLYLLSLWITFQVWPRHGSWINTDRFPKQTPKEKSSSGVRGLGQAPAGKCFRFLCP